MRLKPSHAVLAFAILLGCSDAGQPATPSPDPSAGPRLRLRVDADTVHVGFAITAVPLDSSGRLISPTQVTFTSSAPETATVSPGGQVIGIAPGSVTIGIIRGPDTASTTLRVVPTPFAQASIQLPSGPVYVGDSSMVSAIVRDIAGRIVPYPRVQWSSVNAATLQVSPTGLLVPRAIGQASVRAAVGGVIVTAPIVIPPRPVASITLTATQDSLTYLMPALLVADVRAPNGRRVIDRAPRFIAGPGMFASSRGEVVFPQFSAARTGIVAVELDGVRAEHTFTYVPTDGERLGLQSFGTTLRRNSCGSFRAEVLDRFDKPFQPARVQVTDTSVVKAFSDFLPFALCGAAPGRTTVTFSWGDRAWPYEITVVDEPGTADARILSPLQRLEVGVTHVTRMERLTWFAGQSKLLRWPVLTETEIRNGVRAYAVGDSLVITGIAPTSSARQVVETEVEPLEFHTRVIPPSDPVCPRVAGADVFASSGEYLGRLSDTSFVSAFLSESSRRSGHSVMNIYGRNGSPTSPQSAWNLRATDPPYVRRGSETLGRLTLNSAIPGAINPGAVVHCR